MKVIGSKEADICNGANEARIAGEGRFELILIQGYKGEKGVIAEGMAGVRMCPSGWASTSLPRI